MSVEAVSIEKMGNICVITINRPEVRNAFDGVVATTLKNLLIQFDQDPELNVAVLCGKGGANNTAFLYTSFI